MTETRNLLLALAPVYWHSQRYSHLAVSLVSVSWSVCEVTVSVFSYSGTDNRCRLYCTSKSESEANAEGSWCGYKFDFSEHDDLRDQAAGKRWEQKHKWPEAEARIIAKEAKCTNSTKEARAKPLEQDWARPAC